MSAELLAVACSCGSMDGSMDGLMAGSMDGWMDGWMDGSIAWCDYALSTTTAVDCSAGDICGRLCISCLKTTSHGLFPVVE